VTGLIELWTKGNLDILIVSTTLSIVSLSVGMVQKVSAEKNNFLSFKGQLLLTIFTNLSLFGRLMSILQFFAPPLGLANLLMHWKKGQIYYDNRSDSIFDIQNNTAIYFKSLWITIPHYSNFTIWTLETYYKTFLVLILVHLTLVFGLKCLFAKGFFSMQDLTEKIFHVLTQMFVPWNYKDWDQEGLPG